MSEFRKIVYFERDIYNKIVKNKVDNTQFKEIIKNYIEEIIKNEARKTKYDDRYTDIEVDIDENTGVVKASLDGNEFMTINLDSDIVNGNRSNNSKMSRLRCMIDPAIDIQETMFQLNENDRSTSYGSSLDDENKSQTLENAKEKIFAENSKEMFNIESGEYVNPTIIRKSVLQVYSDALRWDKNMDRDMLNNLVKDFAKQYKRADDGVIEIPPEDFTIEVDGNEEKASYQDMIVAQKPELVENSKDLDKVYNTDGSKKELDEILNLRDNQIKEILENDSLNDDTKKVLENQIKDVYSNVIYDALLKDNLLDMIKRVGYDRVREEIDNLENQEIGKLKSKGGQYQKNIDYLEKNKDRILEKLTPENAKEYEELLNNMKEDLKRQSEASININKEELSKLKEEIEKLKEQVNEKGENITAPYTEEEKEEADKKREEKRDNRNKALRNKANEIKEKNIEKEDPEEYEDVEKDTRDNKQKKSDEKLKDDFKEKYEEDNKNKENVENKDIYYGANKEQVANLEKNVEDLNKKIDGLDRNNSEDRKEIIDKINDIKSKINNINNKENEEELKKIQQDIFELNNKVDNISNESKTQNEPQNNTIEKEDENTLDKNENINLEDKENIQLEGEEELENHNDSSNNKSEVEEDKTISYLDNSNEKAKTNNVKSNEKINDSTINDINNKVSKVDDENLENKKEHEQLKDNLENEIKAEDETTIKDSNSTHEYDFVEKSVDDMKPYAKELSQKMVSMEVSKILSNESIDVHQKAVKIGELNDKKQEFYDFILGLVRKVKSREISLSEYRQMLVDKSKELKKVQNTLEKARTSDSDLSKVEQKMRQEERGNKFEK